MKKILILIISLIISFDFLISFDIHTKKVYAVDEPPEILNVYI